MLSRFLRHPESTEKPVRVQHGWPGACQKNNDKSVPSRVEKRKHAFSGGSKKMQGKGLQDCTWVLHPNAWGLGQALTSDMAGSQN